MEIGIVRQVHIAEEMKTAYLDYAMSVITSRALPDVRDGLKPVQRRILYAINDMGLQYDKPYKKSARIVGEVLGKYHPHGDRAVYDAMVRMAQDFSMRYPLVDGQGNFGSIDGDNAAAMRYTEARLSRLASELLNDIDKDTVDFGSNFDGSLKEPQVLPTRVPNFLLNGATGIAVGMATYVPPHNIGELCDALVYLIDRYDDLDAVAVDELLKFVQGPDFPTGGTILGLDGIRSAYSTGIGRIVVRAKAHVEDAGGGKSHIIVTELPFQVSKAGLIEKIATLVRDKRIDAISDLRDESDRQGMRIVIELKRGAETGPLLKQLWRLTPMQSAFNVNMLALVDGEPRVLSLKRSLQLFVEHRRDVVTRRSKYELEHAIQRAHVLEGLLIALDHLDEVISTIRKSRNADTALANLMNKFKLTEIQARAILDLQLRRLAALERRKIEEEYQEVQARIKYLKSLLASPHKILGVIQDELRAIREEYGDARRTRVANSETEVETGREIVESETAYVIMTADGYIKRVDAKPYELGPMPAEGQEAIRLWARVNAAHSVLFCTSTGRCFTVKAHQLPNSSLKAGVQTFRFLNLQENESIRAILDVSDFQEGFLTICSTQGKIKRTALNEFAAVRADGLEAMSLAPGDELREAALTTGNDELILVTARGQALRFKEEDIRPTGRSAGGVNAIKLTEGDYVVSMGVVEPAAWLVVVTEKGYGKRTPLSDYATYGRYSKGVATLGGDMDANGAIVAATVAQVDDELAIGTAAGVVFYKRVADVPQKPRATRGPAIVKLPTRTDVIGSLARIELEPAAEAEETPAPKRRTKVAADTDETAATKPAGRAKKASGAKTRASGKTGSKAAAASKRASAKSVTAPLIKMIAEEPATSTTKRRQAEKGSVTEDSTEAKAKKSARGAKKTTASSTSAQARKSGTKSQASSDESGSTHKSSTRKTKQDAGKGAEGTPPAKKSTRPSRKATAATKPRDR